MLFSVGNNGRLGLPPSKTDASDPGVVRFNETWAWLQEIFHIFTSTSIDVLLDDYKINPAGPPDLPRLAWKAVLAQYLALRELLQVRVDLFGNKIDRVPQLRLSVSGLDDRIDGFGKIERHYNLILGKNAEATAVKKAVEDSTAELRAVIMNQRAKEDQAAQEMGRLASELGGKNTATNQRKADLRAAVETLSEAVEAHVGCKIERILSALGMCFMFGTKPSPIFGIGGALTVAGAFDLDTISTPSGGTVDKKFVIQHVIDKTDAKGTLRDAIAQSFDEMGQLKIDQEKKYGAILVAREE